MPEGAKGSQRESRVGGNQGSEEMVDNIGQERGCEMCLGCRYTFVFVVPVGYQRTVSGNPQVRGIYMTG